MRKFIFNIGSFLLSTCVAYVLCTFLWMHFIPFDLIKKNAPYPYREKGFSFERLQEIKMQREIDLLFLGSSHAYRGFDTRLFQLNDITSFNLGSPSQTPIQTLFLLEKHLDQLDPHMVILEVYPATFQNDGVESTLDIIANSEITPSLFEMCFKVNHIKTYHALMYDLFVEFLELTPRWNPSSNASDKYVSGGYVQSQTINNLSPVTNKMRKNWDNRKWQMHQSQLKAFEDILNLLKAREIDFALVQNPVTREAYELYNNNSEIDSLFRTFGPYFNMNQLVQLDDNTDFIDYHHMSQTGVEKTCKEVIEILKSNSSLLSATFGSSDTKPL